MMLSLPLCFFFFFLNDTAPTEISPLPLHDALPISLDYPAMSADVIEGMLDASDLVLARGTAQHVIALMVAGREVVKDGEVVGVDVPAMERSEEHTSELQSPCNLVCRLLLEKKKKQN